MFNKNQEVTFISNWDNKGTFSYINLIVYSCGKKRMVLNHKGGECFGNKFDPNSGNIFPVMATEEATAKALEMASDFLIKENKMLEKCLESAPNKNYADAMKNKIAELHEPRAIERPC